MCRFEGVEPGTPVSTHSNLGCMECGHSWHENVRGTYAGHAFVMGDLRDVIAECHTVCPSCSANKHNVGILCVSGGDAALRRIAERVTEPVQARA